MSGPAAGAPLIVGTGAFDICGPLPTGTAVLEASAGTGKTHTIGALATRYIADGIATLGQLLIVTFGRAASQELRERVRMHLVTAERALADPQAARAGPDRLLAMLAGSSAGEVLARRRRLTAALADFDAGTIATTHQFCQQVLTGLGVAGDSESNAILVDNLDDLIVEVVDDIYLRAFAAPGTGEPRFDRTTALRLGRAAVGDPQARLEPIDADPGSTAQWRRRFAEAVRAEVDRRKRRLGWLGYDDLLERLSGALSGEQAAARDRMRQRWRVVLVDEFQDTDPVQWQVLTRAFHGHSTLVLIGDPKQAIYAFRGGDIVTYLGAVRAADSMATLDRNWRSDAALSEALGIILDGAELGDRDIVVRPVTAVHQARRLSGLPNSAPVRLRVLSRTQFSRSSTTPSIAVVREWVARDLAADISELLDSAALIDGRPVSAGDVAVLTATHQQGALAREYLAAQGVPTVIAGAGSVYGTLAGAAWLVLLQALEQPHRADLVRAAALTPFLGRTPAELGSRGDDLSDELSEQIQRWADLFAGRGVAALLEVATAEAGLWARLLGEVDGERRLTDLRHVGEGLHAAAVADGLGLAALAGWLGRRRLETVSDRTDERSRRLDSDAAAVQIVTLHSAKGLEYPIVYLPFAFDRYVPNPDFLLLHDESGRRLLDVGGAQSRGWGERHRRSAAEESGEALRLLYVGLTRAQSQVVAWWAPSHNTPASGLHRLLFGRVPGVAIPDTVPVPSDDEVAKRLAALAAPDRISVEPAVPKPGRSLGPGRAAGAGLTVGTFDRVLDVAWRRSSYTSLTAGGAFEPITGPAGNGFDPTGGVFSEPEISERDDELIPTAVIPVAAERHPAMDLPSPMADLPAGASFGTLVHAVLEKVNAVAPDLAGEVRERCGEELLRHPVPVSPANLADALVPVLTTPLGMLADGRRLADFSRSDRLSELTFELPLTGGDHPDGRGTVGDLAPLLARHLQPGDPLADYAERLTAPELSWKPLRGYLTGSIDAVLRLDGPRYVLVDYKTNHLGEPGGPLTASDYRPEALARAMVGSNYPLQALLYSVALHRFLRWRQPGYDPGEHLGGVLYLFVRGMCGPQTPTVSAAPCGVFGWWPPAELIMDLSDLLDRGRS